MFHNFAAITGKNARKYGKICYNILYSLNCSVMAHNLTAPTIAGVSDLAPTVLTVKQVLLTKYVLLTDDFSFDVSQWRDEEVEQVLKNLSSIYHNLSNPLAPNYLQLCASLFAHWDTTQSPNKGYGFVKVESKKISLEGVVLELIERGDNGALKLIIPYIDPTFHSSLFLRHAVQEMNFDAVRFLLPISNVEEVAHFAVEVASRTANAYLLDVFLPHTDPTALNYALVRYAVHRWAQATTRHDEFRSVVHRVLEAADAVCVSKNQPPLSSNLDAIENLKPSIRIVLETVAQSVHFNRELEEQALAAHTQRATRTRKI